MDQEVRDRYFTTVGGRDFRQDVAALGHDLFVDGDHVQVVAELTATELDTHNEPRLLVDAYELVEGRPSHPLVELRRSVPVVVGDLCVTPDVVRHAANTASPR
ncbi:hypothetical protein ACFPRL_34365 [Pseudoclavibacter helvolus]